MINLASKYGNKIVEVFTKNSFVAGNVSDDYDFAGVRSISIYTPQTVELNDYQREGANRYGTPVEMQDSVQEVEMTQDKGFAITIDKGNNLDQMMVKNAAKMLSLQIKEQVTPYVDRYALAQFARNAGVKKGIATAPTKTDIVEKILEAGAEMDERLVPDDGRVVYLPAQYYNQLRLSTEFLNLENVGTKAVAKGEVGEVGGMKVIKVPSSYMPEGVYFLVTHQRSVLMPFKIKDTKVHQDPPGISGALLEGRNYFDAFVLGSRANGVYVALKSDLMLAAPTITVTSGSATITGTGDTVHYTLDGSDPRYSRSAQLYTAAVTVAAGQMVKAYTAGAGKYCSDVAEKKA